MATSEASGPLEYAHEMLPMAIEYETVTEQRAKHYYERARRQVMHVVCSCARAGERKQTDRPDKQIRSPIFKALSPSTSYRISEQAFPLMNSAASKTISCTLHLPHRNSVSGTWESQPPPLPPTPSSIGKMSTPHDARLSVLRRLGGRATSPRDQCDLFSWCHRTQQLGRDPVGRHKRKSASLQRALTFSI